MRKRSTSESGRDTTTASHIKKNVSISKTRTSRNFSGKSEDFIKKKKQSGDNPSDTKPQNQVLDDKHQTGTAHSAEVVVTSRVLRKDSNLFLTDDKRKDPLPDILDDWKIIVNSLKEPPVDSDSDSTKAHISPIKSISKKVNKKLDKLESDKGTTDTKHPKESQTIKEDLCTPPLKTKPVKQTSSEKKEAKELESTIWRRPTRSTYKAFEDALDTEVTEVLHDFKIEKEENTVENISIKKVELDFDKTETSNKRQTRTVKDIPTSKQTKSVKDSFDSKQFKSTKDSPISKKKKLVKDFPSSNQNKSANNSSISKEGKNSEMNSLLSENTINKLNSNSKVKCLRSINKKFIPQECTVKLIKLEDPLMDDNDDEELDFLGFSPELSEAKGNSIKNRNTLIRAIKGEIGSDISPKLKTEMSPKKLFVKCPEDVLYISDNEIEEILPSEPEFDKQKQTSIQTKKQTFSECFGEDNLPFDKDFEGFDKDCIDQFECKKCDLIYPDSASLFHHRIFAHRTAYLCPLDVGDCGKFRGSVQLSCHLFVVHRKLFDNIIDHFKNDASNGQIAKWDSNKENCNICFYPMNHPELGIHEMFVHGIWPTSIICLNVIKISDIFNIYWTGKMMAFSCQFCKKISKDGISSQYFLCPPSTFVSAIVLHAKDLHKLNISNAQAWWLFYHLLLSLPIETRRTFSSILSLGQNIYGNCAICKVEFVFNQKINLNASRALCMSCEEKHYKISSTRSCWFNCSYVSIDSKSMLEHFLSKHDHALSGGWCIKCGAYTQNLVQHTMNCKKYFKGCPFCNFNASTQKLKDINLIYHSLKFHSFVCPITNCQMPFYNDEIAKIHSVFPSNSKLYKHLTAKHLPDFSTISLPQIPNLLETVLGKRGNSAGSGLMVNLNSIEGFWFGIDKKIYKFVSGYLVHEETVAIPLQCSLCQAKWDCIISRLKSSSNIRTVCPECALNIKQCYNGDILKQCPANRCFYSINSLSKLYEHLKYHHSFFIKQLYSLTCLKCFVKFNSELALTFHYKMKHELVCLFCPYVASNEKQIDDHRCLVHKIPTWKSVFNFFRNPNVICPKSKTPNGVVRVWGDKNTTQVQFDPTIHIFTESKPVSDVVNSAIKKIDEQEFFQLSNESNDSYNWCSNLCTVSMSPLKPTIDKEQNELAVNVQENLIDTELPSDLLIPTITVSEDSDSKSIKDVPLSPEISTPTSKVSNINNSLVNANSKAELFVNTNGIHSNSSSSTSSPLFMGFDSNKTDNFSTASVTFGDVPHKCDSPTHVNIGDLNSRKIVKDLSNLSKSSPNVRKKYLKKGETKGLGENACINEDEMAVNILKDLNENFQSTCVDCGHIISLLDLSIHAAQFHPNKSFQCQCGHFGEMSNYLVHAFHMSHQPCEARPIIMCEGMFSGIQTLIVLEAKPRTKEKSFPCYKCNKRFKQEKSRQLHYNLCKLEKKYQCDQCLEKFAKENHLAKHKEWKHNPQACQHCGKEFNSSSSLTQHVLHIHRKQFNYKCKLCTDSFNTASQLKVHKRIHTGERPYSCRICSYTFISKNLLNKHITYDHSSSSEDEDSSRYREKKMSVDESSKSRKSKKRKRMNIQTKIASLTQSDLETDLSDMDTESKTNQFKTTLKVSSLLGNIASPNIPKGDAVKNHPIALPKLRDDTRSNLFSIGKMCLPCGEEFYSVASKLLHMYLIHPNSVINQVKYIQCGFCSHKFTSADDVTDHHIDKHQRILIGNGSFRCLCGLVFREEGAYYFHLYYAHHAQRALIVGGEVICRICDDKPKLNKIVDLAVHLSDRHTMFDHVRCKDSYMCNFCLKLFESWTVLSLHFFMVHKATKSQTLSYDCPYCEGASPWHSLEALQYHLDNVHRGRHTKSQPVPEHADNIYAPAPGSPKKRKDPPIPSLKFKRQRISKARLSFSGNDESLYCICQCPYDEVSDMIGCDNADCKYQWFHFECVGIMSAPEGNWFCPDCTRNKTQIQQNSSSQSYSTPIYKVANQSTLDTSREIHNSSVSSSSSSSSSTSSNSSSSGSSSSDSSSDSD